MKAKTSHRWRERGAGFDFFEQIHAVGGVEHGQAVSAGGLDVQRWFHEAERQDAAGGRCRCVHGSAQKKNKEKNVALQSTNIKTVQTTAWYR